MCEKKQRTGCDTVELLKPNRKARVPVRYRQAQERFERLIEGMKQAQGITERLKEENALEWTGRLNNIRACAREIVNEEIIFACDKGGRRKFCRLCSLIPTCVIDKQHKICCTNNGQ